MNWLKVPAGQMPSLNALNASAPTNYHVEPSVDSVGNLWVKDALRTAPEYIYFNAWLSQGFTGQDPDPTWPTYTG